MRAVLLVVFTLLMSGCITSFNETEDPDEVSSEPPAPKVLSGRVEAQHSYPAPTAYVGATKTPLSAEFDPPGTTFRIDFGLKWEEETNSFALVVEAPDGETHRYTASGDETEILVALEEPALGPYSFYAEGSGVVRPDELEGFATFHYLVGTQEGEIVPWVQVQRDGDVWLATAQYQAEGEVDEGAQFDLDTFNGGITVESSAEKGQVRVAPWARAPTEERARALLLSLYIDLYVVPDEIYADVSQGDERPRERESFGATIWAWTPVRMGGVLDTTNGPIRVDGIEAEDLDLDTTNGGISGTFKVAGDLVADTTNGRIELTLTPVGSGDWTLDTTNGGIKLRLKESDAIGYRLDASTTNGDIETDMRHASYEGDETDGTVETRDFDARDIQITGSLDTTNGSIEILSK